MAVHAIRMARGEDHAAGAGDFARLLAVSPPPHSPLVSPVSSRVGEQVADPLFVGWGWFRRAPHRRGWGPMAESCQVLCTLAIWSTYSTRIRAMIESVATLYNCFLREHIISCDPHALG